MLEIRDLAKVMPMAPQRDTRYRFSDFLKVGALPTVLIYVLCILLVPVLWPV